MKITIKRIAEIANVSRGAVDKVIHNRPGVSDKLRIKIKRIIRETGYTPNLTAKALKSVEKKLNFAILIPHGDKPMFDMIRKGMESAAEKCRDIGVNNQFHYHNLNDADEIVTILEQIRNSKVDALALRAMDDHRIIDTISSFYDQGIPVITYDSDISSMKRTCYIGENHIEGGRIAANLLAKCLNRTGKVAVLHGLPSVSAHAERVKGFVDAVKNDYPDLYLMDIVETYENEKISYNKTYQLLEENPDLEGIFIVAGCAENIVQAVSDFSDRNKIHIIGYNFVPEIVKLLKEDRIDFTLGLTPYKIGKLVIETLTRICVYNEIIEDSIKTPVYICIKENIDQHLEVPID